MFMCANRSITLRERNLTDWDEKKYVSPFQILSAASMGGGRE